MHKEKVNGPEGSTVYFELAERALDEAIYDRIKEYVSQVSVRIFISYLPLRRKTISVYSVPCHIKLWFEPPIIASN